MITDEALASRGTSDPDPRNDRYPLLRINSRTGVQTVAMQATLLQRVAGLIAEPAGTLLLASPDCCPGALGGVFRLDLANQTQSLLFQGVEGVARKPYSLTLLPNGDILTTFLATTDIRDHPGRPHLFRTDLATGELAEIELDTLLNVPIAVAASMEGEVFVLDRAINDIDPDRLFRVDLENGRTDPFVDVPLMNPHSMIASPDGTLLVGDVVSGGGRVLQIDTRAGVVRQQFDVPSYLSRPTAMVLTPVCGNGVVESGESCDDGNVAYGDGCSSVCADAVSDSIRRR